MQRPATGPRNPLVRALSELGTQRAARRDAHALERRRCQLEQLEPDQRVREVGEW